MNHITTTSPRTLHQLLTLVFLALFVAGCQNPYTQFYTTNIPPGYERRLYPHTGETQYVSAPSDDLQSSVRNLTLRGYIPIGQASFEAGAADYSSSLRAKAKEVQADIVLVSSSYARTQSGIMPLMSYQPGQVSTTYNSGRVNATAYGSGGYAQGTATYSGTSTTTSSGTMQTSYVPYSVQRNNYDAVFFRRYRSVFGAFVSPLSTLQRQQLGRNSGMVVTGVSDESPAFLANILPDDILLELDGQPVLSESWLTAELEKKAGQTIVFNVLRQGSNLEVKVKLNPASL